MMTGDTLHKILQPHSDTKKGTTLAQRHYHITRQKYGEEVSKNTFEHTYRGLKIKL